MQASTSKARDNKSQKTPTKIKSKGKKQKLNETYSEMNPEITESLQ